MKTSQKRPVSRSQRARAGAMRRVQTEPERKLWHALRYRVPVEGTHFRRQVPIGAFIVDFCCHRAKLVIEVDGNQHGTDAALERDAIRTVEIEAEEYRVLRFSNYEVCCQFESVLDTIFAAVAARIPPSDIGSDA